MNTDEINRTIAELLGYTCEARAMNADYETYILTPDNTRLEYTVAWYAPQDGSVSWAMLFDDDVRIEGFRDNEVVPPRWATDTDAAIHLLDELPKQLNIDIHRSPMDDAKRVIWYCEFSNRIDGRVAWSVGRCNTQAEAICSAFIEYKRAQP